MDNIEELPQQINKLLAPSAIKINASSIEIGDKLARTLFISTYPRYVRGGWFSSIINMGSRFDVSIFLHPKDTGKVLKQLRSQLARLIAQTTDEISDGKVRNPVLETAIGDIESLRDSLQQGSDKFFELGVYITLYAKDLKSLNENENTVRGILDAQLVYTKKAIFKMEEGFKSTLPIANDLLQIHTSANTEPISSIFPFISYDLTSNDGLLYGINLHNNSLVLFDRFKLENANTVIFGKSGGGKSYSVKLEILRNLFFGVQIFVIDPENEYHFLAEAVSGTVVNISVSSGNHINPFELPKPQPDEHFEDVLRSHITSLMGFFRILLGNLTPEEESIMDEALRQTYASKDITEVSLDEKIPAPLMGDFQSILEGMQGAESLAIRIRRYTEGTLSGFLNNPTNVNLDNQFVVFSIRDMEDELRPIAMYLVLNYVWGKVRSEMRKRLLIVDEAWWLMKYKFGGEFLLNIAKRARKYYLGLTTISQDVSDFMNSEYGKPIITNSSLQMLLKQSSA
ncbi:MAG: ATP-binding protein, partial [Nitrosarchaeum sp.]|nr:ATP-binding protein [Nitrosarchaeum sp.]